jgi:hypothetical protein
VPGLPSPVSPSATPARRVNRTLMARAALLVILFRGVLPGGAKRARTADPLLAKQVLFQLSYSPVMRPPKPTRAAEQPSGQQRHWYQRRATGEEERPA